MQLNILALDSAATLCSAAVRSKNGTFQIKSQPGQKHTEVILGMIEDALEKASLSLGELDAVAFGAGPGAFTGLRVACGIAQGIGWALDKPLLPVNNLSAIAERVLEPYAAGTKVFIAVDARMHECYCGGFEKTADGLKPLSDSLLLKPEELVGTAKKLGCIIFAGNGFEAYKIQVPPDLGVYRSDINVADAEMLLAPAVKLFEAGKAVKPEEAAPLYVRNHVAQTIEERKAAK